MFLDIEPMDDPEPIARMILSAMLWMICPPHEQRYHITLTTQTGIIRSIHNGEFVDLIARIMTRLNLPNVVWRDRDIALLDSVDILFEALELFFDKGELEHGFQDYAPRWQRFYQHMMVGGSRMSTSTLHAPSFQPTHTQCTKSWLLIARCIGLEPEASNIIGISCSSGRCPGAYSPRFGCSSCAQAIYCDVRCQAMHRRFGGCRPGPKHARHES
ncbi:hypothetical protein RSAG8_06033, partial [Rhizoctonia solani AG-8 WAC10335]